MGLLNSTAAAAWNLGQWIRSPMAKRRTSLPIDTSRERIYHFGPRMGGIYMTHEEAVRLSAVWACISVISKGLASCRWDVFIERPNGDREMRREMMAYRILNRRPNSEMTPFAFREAAAIQALVWGNFIAEIERDMAGNPVALWPIAPERWRFERNRETGDLEVVISNRDMTDARLAYTDVYHVHGPGMDGIAGFDTVAVAARSLGHAAAAQRFGSAYYNNGTQMGGVLTSEQNLGQEAIDQLSAAIKERHQGPDNAFDFLVLGGGLEYKQLAPNPNQGQFIQTQQHLIEEVCRWFGVPPHKIQHLLRMTFNNIEHQGLEFVRDALIPWAERFAQEADWKLLPDWRGIKSRIDTDWLAEGDAKSKADTDSILVQNGLMSRNEARKRRGLNTLGPEGDKITAQMNLTTLEKIGEDKPDPEPEPEPEQAPQEEEASPAEQALVAAFEPMLNEGLCHLEDVAAGIDPNATTEEFESEIRAALPEYAQALGTWVGRAFGTVTAAGFELPHLDRAKDFLETALEEDVGLLVQAFEGGQMDAWCDIPTRARDLAEQLAATICEE